MMSARGTWFMRDVPVIVWLTCAVIIALLHPVFDASRWLVIHVVALGGFTHSIMVWSVHFSNALLKTKDVESRRMQNIRLTLLQVGMLAVFIGVPTGWWLLTVIGGVMISAVMLWHAGALWYRLRIALPGRFRISVRYYIAAAAFLPAGILLGVLLASGVSADGYARLLVAHTMVNFLGWVGLAILGTLVTLWPTMLRTRMAEGAEQASIRALPILSLGLVTIVVGALVNLPWLGVVGVAIYLLGTIFNYVPIWQAARHRTPHSFPTLSASAALLWLPIALVTLGVKIVADGWQPLAVSFGVLTVMFLIGFGLQMLFGALSYLVPVIVGGGPRPLRAGMHELNRLGTWRVVTVNLALVLCLLPVPVLVRTVLSLIALVALALTLVYIVRGIFVMLRTKRQVAAEMAAQGIRSGGVPPRAKRDMGVIDPKLSKPQVVAAVVTVALGVVLGIGLDSVDSQPAMIFTEVVAETAHKGQLAATELTTVTRDCTIAP